MVWRMNEIRFIDMFCGIGGFRLGLERRIKKTQVGKHRQDAIYDASGIAPTIPQGTHGSTPHLLKIIVSDVSGQTTMTNTPAKSTENTGETGNSTKEASEQLMLMPYRNTISSVRDFLARVSALLESGEDLKILEAHSSLKYAESYGLKDLAIYSLKMSKACSPTMMATPLKPLSERWMNWGMTVNGKCLTARITESHKTGKGCSLSDILEENPDQKYFLSEKMVKVMERIVERAQETGSGWRQPLIQTTGRE